MEVQGVLIPLHQDYDSKQCYNTKIAPKQFYFLKQDFKQHIGLVHQSENEKLPP